MNTRCYLPAALATLAGLWFPGLANAENEIGFVEKFALAADREKALAELVPGTDDYYYYHALHYQNTRNEGRLAEVLNDWKRRWPDENARRRVIENREALLDYETAPKQTLDYLKERLHVELNHQRQIPGEQSDVPTALDPKLITREAFEAEALANSGDLEGFSEGALEQFVPARAKLSDQQKKALLTKLKRPNVAGLVEFIAEELKRENADAFGTFEIHKQLLPEQLDALVKLVPSLAVDDAFVKTRLTKLAPSDDDDVTRNPAQMEAWLDRLWTYAQTLPPAFNTLKAQVLYRRLVHDREKGIYDAARFLEYLKLPRAAAYTNEKYLEAAQEGHRAALGTDLSSTLPGFTAVGDDEALVRDYFLTLFQLAAKAAPAKAGEDLMTPYAPYVQTTWLRPVLAEALIVGGFGNAEQWAAWLSPEAFQALKDRVDVDFAADNPKQLKPGDEVQLDVFFKNTPQVIVKIYELNTLNFYQTQQRELNTDLNLDGLVANTEKTIPFETGPFRRFRHTLKFPNLKGKRGAWMIELIGNGRSSRALVRVGQWQALPQRGPTGDMLLVVDENGERVKGAVAWLDGRKFEANEVTDRITIPYSAEEKKRDIVLADKEGAFACKVAFEQHKEEYQLAARFHLEREQLLSGREATMGISIDLKLGDAHLDPALLKDLKVTVTAHTQKGVETTKEFPISDPKASRDSVVTFTVPNDPITLNVKLSGKIPILSKGGELVTLTAHDSWVMRLMDTYGFASFGRLSKFGSEYVYEAIGKNGEGIPNAPVIVSINYDGIDRLRSFALKTDQMGRINLGALAGVARVAISNELDNDAYKLEEWRAEWPLAIHAKSGDVVRLPWQAPFAGIQQPQRADLTLLEMRGGTPVADWSSKIVLKDGLVEIPGLPKGDFVLTPKGRLWPARTVQISVVEGTLTAGWCVGQSRTAKTNNSAPLSLARITADENTVAVKVVGVGPFTRVRVAALHYYEELQDLELAKQKATQQQPKFSTLFAPSLYSTGREIGDEYRYILERRYAKIFPGNMLPRPGLLLNPWMTSDTDARALTAAQGQAAAAAEIPRPQSISSGRMSKMKGGKSDGSVIANLDFIANPAPVIFNLIPDAEGMVRIDRKALGDRQFVQIIAEDLENRVAQSFALPEVPLRKVDRRFTAVLDPAKPYALAREATVLETGRAFTVEDTLSAEAEIYDSLPRVFALLVSLGGENKLAGYSWLMEWPKLKDDEKRAKYGEHASHELNVFLWKKDPAFFDKVIKPALANKKDKTFIDHFLLSADLSPYLEPWSYKELNAAERALLALRLPAEADAAARELREKWELLPPQVDLASRRFDTALMGRSMEERGRDRFKETVLTGELSNEAGALGQPLRGLAVADPSATTANGPLPPPAPAKPMEAAPGNAARAYVAAGAKTAGFAGRDAAAKLDDLNSDKAEPQSKSMRYALGANRADESGVKEEMQQLEQAKKVTRWDAQRGNTEFFFSTADVEKLKEESRLYYRSMGVAKEWAENNYDQLRIAVQNASLVQVNAFWRDYAKWIAEGAKGAFISPAITDASSNFTEKMLALAVTDLPFEAPKHSSRKEGDAKVFVAGGPGIVYHKQMKLAKAAEAEAAGGKLLVAQSFFRVDDRYRTEGNEKFEKYVSSEFLAGVIYGANVVVTNPTSSPVKGSVLLQIPEGAIPVKLTKATDAQAVELAPYTTQTFEYSFYFPAPSGAKKFRHFPVNVSVGGKVVGAAKPMEFNVVAKLTEEDKTSWGFVSQQGTDAQVFAFLNANNIAALDLEKVAWRCKDAAFFKRLTALMAERHVWNEAIYRYALAHNDAAALREWLKHKDDFLSQCGPWLSSKLILIDPIARRTYEHLEYSPLVNQRAHRLGAEHRIANPAVLAQYQSLLDGLACKPALEPMDQLSATYYLFLQDRVEEGLTRFRGIDATALPTKIQHDYLRCYADLYEGNLADARGIAARYADHPVPRWQQLFAGVTSQLDEIEGKGAGAPRGDKPDREREHGNLAASEPGYDFKVENKTVSLNYRNLAEVTIHYYKMDPEFAFSSSPFVSQDSGRFTIVKPTLTTTHKLPKDKDTLDIPLPAEFAQANVLVEVQGAGKRSTKTYHANTMKLAVTENYGRLEARDAATDRPLPKAYVKVYARLRGGAVRFYKDGYTDLRGRFDYASLNDPAGQVSLQESSEAPPANGLDYKMLKPEEVSSVEKMAILILSDTNGAATREVKPPSR